MHIDWPNLKCFFLIVIRAEEATFMGEFVSDFVGHVIIFFLNQFSGNLALQSVSLVEVNGISGNQDFTNLIKCYSNCSSFCDFDYMFVT